MLPGSQNLPVSSFSSKAPIVYKFITFLCGPNDNQEKVISPIFPQDNSSSNNKSS